MSRLTGCTVVPDRRAITPPKSNSSVPDHFAVSASVIWLMTCCRSSFTTITGLPSSVTGFAFGLAALGFGLASAGFVAACSISRDR